MSLSLFFPLVSTREQAPPSTLLPLVLLLAISLTAHALSTFRPPRLGAAAVTRRIAHWAFFGRSSRLRTETLVLASLFLSPLYACVYSNRLSRIGV